MKLWRLGTRIPVAGNGWVGIGDKPKVKAIKVRRADGSTKGGAHKPGKHAK